MTVDDVFNNIANGVYTPSSEFDYTIQDPDRRSKRRAWVAEYSRLESQFKTDAMTATGLIAHPKGEKAWTISWDQNHGLGFQDVLYSLIELADLLS